MDIIKPELVGIKLQILGIVKIYNGLIPFLGKHLQFHNITQETIILANCQQATAAKAELAGSLVITGSYSGSSCIYGTNHIVYTDSCGIEGKGLAGAGCAFQGKADRLRCLAFKIKGA